MRLIILGPCTAWFGTFRGRVRQRPFLWLKVRSRLRGKNDRHEPPIYSHPCSHRRGDRGRSDKCNACNQKHGRRGSFAIGQGENGHNWVLPYNIVKICKWKRRFRGYRQDLKHQGRIGVALVWLAPTATTDQLLPSLGSMQSNEF